MGQMKELAQRIQDNFQFEEMTIIIPKRSKTILEKQAQKYGVSVNEIICRLLHGDNKADEKDDDFLSVKK